MLPFTATKATTILISTHIKKINSASLPSLDFCGDLPQLREVGKECISARAGVLDFCHCCCDIVIGFDYC